MVDSPAKPISDSVQMYLVKIKRLQEQIRPVPLSFLADSLCISPVSVNEMCRKMQEQNLIEYQPYKGASLTEEGERAAAQVLRHHRLWEVFLVEKLQFSAAEAHEIADELEHATSKELAERLDLFLGNPTVSPDGHSVNAGVIIIEPRKAVKVVSGTGDHKNEARRFQSAESARTTHHESTKTRKKTAGPAFSKFFVIS